jgi:predicted nucleotidyltransferase
MFTELDVLGLVSDRLTELGLPFMLTGSFALAYYATPRMTRDIDIVLAIEASGVDPMVASFARDFYVDGELARAAIHSETLFNLMHLDSGVKVDFIVRKSSEYRRLEFERRKLISVAGVRTWVVSREDLILSKLLWARESGSEMQRRDIRLLLDGDLDLDYLERWAKDLGVTGLLEELSP